MKRKIIIATALILGVGIVFILMRRGKSGGVLNKASTGISSPSMMATKKLSPYMASLKQIKGYIDRVDGELKPYVEGTEEATEALLEGKLKHGDAILGTDGRPVQII